ncbi:MAG: gliding motility-associated ABC transporter substrate-binding protein GldG [Chitinophagales bacterium]|nr:gliding motility-associated ABC transporter substrate-binding protein GldG [Chitinophagales bacterium]
MKFFRENINAIIIVFILVTLNVIGSFFFTRLDLTEEKRYSISDPTKEFLKNLDDVVTVRVYLTGNLPAGMRALEKSIESTLNEFKAYAGNQLEFDFVDLNEYEQEVQEEEGKVLMSKGLSPISLTVVESGEQTQRVLFPGAIVIYKGRVISVNLLENKVGYDQYQILNNSMVLVEYKLANAIQKLQQTHPPVVAFSNGHGEIGQEQLAEVIEDLQSEQFAVSTIDLSVGYGIDSMVDVLVVAKPTTPFSEKEKYKIDQYLMRGGKILWLIDQINVDMDSLQGKDFYMAEARDLNIDDMLFQYGVRINDDLILDLQNTRLEVQTGVLNNQAQTQWFNWPYFNLMIGNNKHPISRNLAPIAGRFSSTLDTIKSVNIKKEILLSSSNYSKALFAPARVFIGMVKDPMDPSLFTQKELPTAVALSGEFPSIFRNRAFTGAYAAMIDTVEGLKFRETSVSSAKMIVVSDGDLIANQVRKGKQLPIGYAVYGNNNDAMVFDNKPFFINSIEYLIDANNLIETRNKVVKLRQLDAIKVKENRNFIQLNTMISPILILTLFGLIFTFVRRRKYGST